LLFFAALYHDIAKPRTRSVDDDGRVRFFDHDKQGAKIAARRARRLRLSNDEVGRVKRIVHHHMRPTLLANEARGPSKRAVYRFFRDTGEAGVDICLLSLADVAAAYGHTLPPERWHRQIEVARRLLEAWWNHPQTEVAPPALITGKDLLNLGVEPGPLIGETLEAVRLAQIEGIIRSREDALEFAEQFLEKSKHE
jgi:putative nucleotidyltransferase with HDIG domain